MTPAPVVRGTDPDDDLRPFRNITTWVFDLDNTLYPLSSGLWPQIDDKIRDFIMQALGVPPDEAVRLQHDFHDRYGATLRGLMIEHGIGPDAFLAHVHDIDHSLLTPNPALAALLKRLPGRRFILTNGSVPHADKVTARLGLSGLFEKTYDIVWANLVPKPAREVYDRMLAEIGVAAGEVALFEDLVRNLRVPNALGMTSVLVVPPTTRNLFRGSWDLEAGPDREADFITEDLNGFLEAVLKMLGR